MANLQVVRNSQEYPKGDVLGRPVFDSSLNRIVIVKEGATTAPASQSPQTITTVSATRTLLPTETVVLLTGTSTYNVALPLPSAASGIIFRFKKTGASGVVTLTTPGAETIDGAASLDITAQYRSVEILSDGTNWHLLIDSTPAAG